MKSKKDIKLYLAGPEVFLPNAVEHAEMQRELCRQYGFIGLHPMDNNIAISVQVYETAVKIYRGDVCQIRECDIVVANCNQFRGVLIDDGTAYELGFGNALGKPSYGYRIDACRCVIRAFEKKFAFFARESGYYIDADGYIFVDEFGTVINLMMQCGMTEHGGRLVIGSFEDCLRAIRDDLDKGVLIIPDTKGRQWNRRKYR